MTRITAIVGALCLLLSAHTALAYPPGFVQRSVASGWTNPVGITFAADGRPFVWEKGGRVWFIENGQKQLILDISEEVGDWRDHGMLGFALHPSFLTTGYMYVYYAVDRHHLMNHGTPAYDPNANHYYQASIARVTRYTARIGDGFRTVNPDSRLVLIGESVSTGIPLLHESHLVGSLVFATDGTLMVSAGDSGSYIERDVGGNDGGSYAPQARADGILTQKRDVGSFRAQYVDSHNGKVLRIDASTGDGIPSNPYYDAGAPRAPRSRVWSLGLRNPFRMTKKPLTGSHNQADADPGTFYIGDVGWFLWEEIHVADGPAQNFGWPVYDGMTIQQSYVNLSPVNPDAPNPIAGGGCNDHILFSDLIIQDTLEADPFFPNPCNNGIALPNSLNLFVHSRPAVDWSHNEIIARVPGFSGVNPVAINLGTGGAPPGAPFNGFSSTGGVWYTGTAYPAEYQNTYFHADFAGQWLRNFAFDGNNQLTEVSEFQLGAGNVVSIAVHPIDEELYFVRYPSSVRRVEYTPSGNQPPLAVAQSDVQYGVSPLTVQFDGTGSSDPENAGLTYQWDFGDGQNTSGATPSHTFNAPPNTPTPFIVTLTVSDPGGETAQTEMTISVNNTPPQVLITSPISGTFFDSNSQSLVDLDAIISDTEHSLAELDCQWQAVLHHNDHLHPEPVVNDCSTTAVVSPVGCDDEETYFYEFTLTVTDPAGLSTTERVELVPDCGNSIELRLVTTDLDAGPIVLTEQQGNIDLYVQARIVGDPDATGLVTFVGGIQDDGSGLFDAAPLTLREATGLEFPGPDPDGRTGMFPSYRATIGNNNDDTGNGDFYNQAWNILPLNISFNGNGEGLNGEWSDVYKLNWTTADFSERIVQLTTDATFGGYQSTNGLIEPVQVAADNLLMTIDPNSCLCDYITDGTVDVLDLLAFLGPWFGGLPAADVTGDGTVDVLDLLDFLTCWFPASAGDPCP